MRLLLAHRLMVVYVMPAAGAAALYMTIPSLRTPMWALMSLGGAAAILTGVHVNRPAHRWPWLVVAAGLLAFAAGDIYSPSSSANAYRNTTCWLTAASKG
ncbi:hypothetical protein QF037_001771 [Streptomyces canus]|uniref:hypothetical protein n=1 Tax=Streptomyces canus TaxID=58343 RepID=UPI0027853A7B|nr:hypothetical protein [Streptomyces canus]MDQ0597426.1 hypothetical protein [Streptomyces canus]